MTFHEVLTDKNNLNRTAIFRTYLRLYQLTGRTYYLQTLKVLSGNTLSILNFV